MERATGLSRAGGVTFRNERGLPVGRLVLLSLVIAIVAGCTDPRLNAGLSLGPDGLRVSPSVSAGLGGGGRIAYSP